MLKAYYLWGNNYNINIFYYKVLDSVHTVYVLLRSDVGTGASVHLAADPARTGGLRYRRSATVSDALRRVLAASAARSMCHPYQSVLVDWSVPRGRACHCAHAVARLALAACLFLAAASRICALLHLVARVGAISSRLGSSRCCYWDSQENRTRQWRMR